MEETLKTNGHFATSASAAVVNVVCMDVIAATIYRNDTMIDEFFQMICTSASSFVDVDACTVLRISFVYFFEISIFFYQ